MPNELLLPRLALFLFSSLPGPLGNIKEKIHEVVFTQEACEGSEIRGEGPRSGKAVQGP